MKLTSPKIVPAFTHNTFLMLVRMSSTKLRQRGTNTRLFLLWVGVNSDSSCYVCQHFDALSKGGRPKKVRHATGRPANNSPRYCAQTIRAIAPSAFVSTHHTTPSICEDHAVVDLRQLQCPICCEVLQCPVELVDCHNVVCAECYCSWLQYSNDKLSLSQ